VRSGFVLRAAAFTSVAMVRVEVDVAVPLGVTDVGLNVQVLFAGRPEQERLIAWLNPPDGVMVMVDVADDPGLTEPVEGFKAILKSPAGAAVMVTTTAEEDEAALAVSPPYVAVMLWVPTLSVAVEKVATPEARLPVPIDVVPSENVTVPVGVAVPDVSVTDALKLIVVPEEAVVGKAVSWVVVAASVGALPMVKLSTVETDAA
jgi:hypothetical protein